MVNKVILIGRLGRDPEARKTNSGMAVAELRLATSRGRGDDEQTDWHTIVCFDKTAEVVTKYLAKGRQVYVEGRLQHDSWEDKETVATMQKVVAQPHARAAVAVAVETFQKMTFHFEVIDEVQ